LISGYTFYVPENAELALREVSTWGNGVACPDLEKDMDLSDAEDMLVPVWIDVICIQQTELTERSQQVSIMGQIYSKANTGLVSLGTGTDEDAKLIKEAAQRLIDSVPPDCKDGLAIKEYTEEFVGTINRDCQNALYRLFGQPWFRRMWYVCLSLAVFGRS